MSDETKIGGAELKDIKDSNVNIGNVDARVTAGGDIVGGDKTEIRNYYYYYGSQAQPVEEIPPQPFEPETILIPAGPFVMGSDDGQAYEGPQHTVNLPAYQIGQAPVTNREYATFIKANKTQDEPEGWFLRKPPAGQEDRPVVGVSWADARAYCRWLYRQTGRAYRLPTEAEWEKAIRSSTELQGPVEEWTSTLWGSNPHQSDFPYPYDPTDGREELDAPSHLFRVCRGRVDQTLPPAHRSFDHPANRLAWRGFRVVITK